MIFEVYDSVNDHPEHELTLEGKNMEGFLKECLYSFPVQRVRIRKNYSTKNNEISIDVELDSTISSEKIYNKIVYRIFKVLQIDLITLQNNGNYSNFSYFFYGEKMIFKYNCSIFIDVPSKGYLSVVGKTH